MADDMFYHGGMTLVDITKDTVTAQTLYKGVTAHDANGKLLVGIMDGTISSENLDAELTEQDNLISEQDSLIAQIRAALELKMTGGAN